MTQLSKGLLNCRARNRFEHQIRFLLEDELDDLRVLCEMERSELVVSLRVDVSAIFQQPLDDFDVIESRCDVKRRTAICIFFMNPRRVVLHKLQCFLPVL